MRLSWKSFLLRPRPTAEPRSLEAFRSYTESWQRALDEEPGAAFRPGWSGTEGPPSHSIPPHAWVHAARRRTSQPQADESGEGNASQPAAWLKLHRALFSAYFSEHRDITSLPVLQDLWRDAGLGEFPSNLASFEAEIVAEHQEALAYGASGAPAVRAEGSGYGVLMGAQPTASYRRWVERLQAARRDG